MRLNQATDYAFRMVLYLASLPEGTKITGAALAEKQNIPERFLLKIMGSCSKGCSGMCSIYAAFAGIQRNLAKQLKSYNFEDLANQEKAIKNAEEAVKAAAAPDEDKAKAE